MNIPCGRKAKRLCDGGPECWCKNPEQYTRVQRLIDACEGELDGLAVPLETAQRILCYVMGDGGYLPASVGVRGAVEERAREIYDGWTHMQGWVPWVEGGNSHMQDEARRLAAQ
jgi:hypothetical protein